MGFLVLAYCMAIHDCHVVEEEEEEVVVVVVVGGTAHAEHTEQRAALAGVKTCASGCKDMCRRV